MDVFFIVFDLVFGRAAGAENADGIFNSLDKANKDNSTERGGADDDLAVFRLRMSFVIEDKGERIVEDGHGFFKIDAVFA